jgi:WD40 repeat protein
VVALPHKSVVRAVGWLGDGDRFVTGDSSGALRTWRDGEAPVVLDEHDLNDEVIALSRSPDGAWIAALGALGGLTLLNVEGGVWGAPEDVAGLVTGTAWSGSSLLCALRTGELVRLHPTSRHVESVDVGAGHLLALEVASDRVATSSPDGAVQVRLGARSFTLIRPGDPSTRSLRWMGEDGPLVGLTDQGAVWAWGIEDLDEPEPVYCDAAITAICASERGDWLAAVTRDGGLRVWPFGLSTLRALLQRACAIPLREDQRRRYLGDGPQRRR